MRSPLAFSIAAVLLASCSPSAPSSSSKEKQPAVAAKPAPAYFTVDPATAATVTGKAIFRGARPRLQKFQIDEDPTCVKLNKAGITEETVIVGTGSALANVFVSVKKGLEGKQFSPPAAQTVAVIDQKNCRFAPHVIGVRVGQTIRVLNSDPLTHNIHPLAKENREWNQSQPEGAEPLERRFVRPEMYMRVKCNVHSWMRAYVSVMEHPYFAVTAADGSFEIPNLPPGDYTFEAWHEKLGVQEFNVHLDPSARHTLSITFPGATKTP